jgi:hypothetical protein
LFHRRAGPRRQPRITTFRLWIRRSVLRGVPFGDDGWTERAASELSLETTLRPRGRPREE